MDPTVTLQIALYAIENREWDLAAHSLSNLHNWLDAGGFPPSWPDRRMNLSLLEGFRALVAAARVD